jgi:hypothetical protein
MRESARFEGIAFVPLCWKEVHRQHDIHDFLGERVVASFEFFAQKLGIVSHQLAEEVFPALIRELVAVKTPSSNMRISLTWAVTLNFSGGLAGHSPDDATSSKLVSKTDRGGCPMVEGAEFARENSA